MGASSSGAKLEERYFLQKVKLGQGSFGTVWRAVDRHTDQVVAIKQMEKSKMPRRGITRADVEREISMMRACCHENITKLFDTFEDQGSIYLALEYCDGGDFGDKVKERGMSLREEEAADWMRQVLSAVAALHSKGVCHRDIKPDNFMVREGRLKLADFGLALFLAEGRLLTEKCGTPAFMAPEQHHLPKKSKGYSFPVDLWASGVLMYMLMFAGRHPFLTDKGGLDEKRLLRGEMNFSTGESTSFFGQLFVAGDEERFSHTARQFCRRLVDPNPSSRLTAPNAMRDPYIGAAIRAAPPQNMNGARRPSRDSGPQAQPAPQNVEKRPQDKSNADPGVPFPAQAPANGGYPAPQGNGGQESSQWWPFPTPKAVHDALFAKDQEVEAGQQKIASLERKLEKAQAQLHENSFVPPMQGGSGETWIRPGLKCRYFSSKGWINGCIKKFNESDATVDLDVKREVPLEKVSPTAAVTFEEAWPAGMLVKYESVSMSTWLPAVVVSFNTDDGTYNLDVRDHATVEKIRLRDPREEPVPDSQDVQFAGGATQAAPQNGGRRDTGRGISRQGTRMGGDGFEHRNSQPLPPPRGDMEGGRPTHFVEDDMRSANPYPAAAEKTMKGEGNLGAAGRTTKGPGQDAPMRLRDLEGGGVNLLQEGSRCLLHVGVTPQGPSWAFAVIEGFNNDDETYRVSTQEKREARVPVDRIRAPAEAPWPPGTSVSYESSSLNRWLPAVVLSFNGDDKTYNLDVREHAPPVRVRPRVRDDGKAGAAGTDAGRPVDQPAQDGHSGAPLRLQDLKNGSGNPSVLEVGMKCLADMTMGLQQNPAWAPAVIEFFSSNDRTYRVRFIKDQREVQIGTDHLRAPTDSPWPSGTAVAYESASMGLLPAVILSFNEKDRTYNLDVREHAAADRIRPRGLQDEGTASL